jgi:hypothetical protein
VLRRTNFQSYNAQLTTKRGSMSSSAQERFDRRYITATEVSIEMNVSRASVLRARERGELPDAVIVGDHYVCIWERARLRPYLTAWKERLASRKGQA